MTLAIKKNNSTYYINLIIYFYLIVELLVCDDILNVDSIL